MVLSIGNDPTFKRFCDGFGLRHLLGDERFATNAARVQNRKLVTDTLSPVSGRQSGTPGTARGAVRYCQDVGDAAYRRIAVTGRD
jgi:crotonobetainyl-CoA:carnitine CoA-transferase CaiB-like acyl-CoA transferase